MGAGCVFCTLWADGFNGVYEHLANRAAFAVSTPDRSPEAQHRFAAGRGWRFPMVSHQGTNFAADMGYRSESGGFMPGVSVFRRDGDRITRVGDTALGPGDDFCSVWHFLDLLPEGANGWRPGAVQLWLTYPCPSRCENRLEPGSIGGLARVATRTT